MLRKFTHTILLIFALILSGQIAAQAQCSANFNASVSFLETGKIVNVIWRGSGASVPSSIRVDNDPRDVFFNLSSTPAAGGQNAYVVTFPVPMRYRDGGTHIFKFIDSFGAAKCQLNFTFSATTPNYNHLKYFGYYYSSYYISNLRSPYTAEIAGGYGNTASVFAFDNSSVVSLLQEVQSLGMRAIINVPAYAAGESGGKMGTCELYLDWQARLDAFAFAIQPFVNSGTVVAFNQFDEPYNECIATIETVIGYMKPKFLNIPHWVNFLPNPYSPWPSNVDWVSMDNYIYNGSTGFGQTNDIFNIMRSRLSGNQKMVVISDGYAKGCYLSQCDASLLLETSKYFDLATDPNVIAISGFIWQKLQEATAGIRDMPKTRAFYAEFYEYMNTIRPPSWP